MSIHDCFIGIDGGGTHSSAVLIDRNFRVLSRGTGDSLNYYSVGFEKAKFNFFNLVLKTIHKINPSRIKGVFIGMSAIDREESQENISKFVGDLFPKAKVFMHSDLYIAFMGFTLGTPGIMVISGTGAMAIVLDKSNREWVAGGYGYLLGDYGSAYSIAVDAIKVATGAFDNINPQTVLQESLLNYFKVNNHREIIDIIYRSDNPRKLISGFAPEVTKAASQNDTYSLEILKRNAKYLAQLALSLMKKEGLNDLEKIGIYGGVFENDQYVKQFFTEYVKQECPNIKIQLPNIRPEFGAAIAAMIRCGIHVKKEEINQFLEGANV